MFYILWQAESWDFWCMTTANSCPQIYVDVRIVASVDVTDTKDEGLNIQYIVSDPSVLR